MTALRAEGIQSVAFNYRNVGDSGGSLTTLPGLLRDAEAVLTKFVAAPLETGGLGVPNNRIILWGHSIGGAVAAHLAGQPSAKGVRLVADRSFSSLAGFVSDGLLGRPSPALESLLELITGWRFGVSVAWSHVGGKRVILEHDDDDVIPLDLFPASHIFGPGSSSVDKNRAVVGLGEPLLDAHCRDLTRGEIRRVLKLIA